MKINSEIQRMNNEQTTIQRRDFIKKSLGAAGVFLCVSGFSTLLDSCASSFNASPDGTAYIEVDSVPELSKDGGVAERTFEGQFDDTPVIIIRENLTSYLAFSSVCTHYGRKVSAPDNASSDMICHTHNAHFSPVDGRVLSGPAKSSLTKYVTSFNVEKKILTISKKNN